MSVLLKVFNKIIGYEREHAVELGALGIGKSVSAGIHSFIDHIIDLGPEGGSAGGEIVAEGTPEQVAAVPGSFTGQYLRPLLERDRAQRAAEAEKR